MARSVANRLNADTLRELAERGRKSHSVSRTPAADARQRASLTPCGKVFGRRC